MLRVEEGGEAFVTEEHLLVRDRDTREEVLEVELQRVPRHGQLKLQGQTLHRGARFSLRDLRGLRLRSGVGNRGNRFVFSLQTVLCWRLYDWSTQWMLGVMQVRPR